MQLEEGMIAGQGDSWQERQLVDKILLSTGAEAGQLHGRGIKEGRDHVLGI